MNKKHFLILGRAGLIYYSWLLIVLLISLILTYEGTRAVNWPAIICGVIFIILTSYTYFNSFWKTGWLKLPFKKRIKNQGEPKLVYHRKLIKIYEIRVAELEKYRLLRIVKD